MAKCRMGMCVLGMAEEFRKQGIAVNALLATHDHRHTGFAGDSGTEPERGRTPDIMADAAWQILAQDNRTR